MIYSGTKILGSRDFFYDTEGVILDVAWDCDKEEWDYLCGFDCHQEGWYEAWGELYLFDVLELYKPLWKYTQPPIEIIRQSDILLSASNNEIKTYLKSTSLISSSSSSSSARLTEPSVE